MVIVLQLIAYALVIGIVGQLIADAFVDMGTGW